MRYRVYRKVLMVAMRIIGRKRYKYAVLQEEIAYDELCYDARFYDDTMLSHSIQTGY